MFFYIFIFQTICKNAENAWTITVLDGYPGTPGAPLESPTTGLAVHHSDAKQISVTNNDAHQWKRRRRSSVSQHTLGIYEIPKSINIKTLKKNCKIVRIRIPAGIRELSPRSRRLGSIMRNEPPAPGTREPGTPWIIERERWERDGWKIKKKNQKSKEEKKT